MRAALHTRVRADRIGAYEQAHRAVAEELVAAIHAVGATEWTIWGSGTELFHFLEVQYREKPTSELGELPVNIAWRARMAEQLKIVDDYSADGADAPLPVVWQP